MQQFKEMWIYFSVTRSVFLVTYGLVSSDLNLKISITTGVTIACRNKENNKN